MPTYEYGCDACGASWEKEQRISDKPLRKCPACGAMKARRMISSGNFILKGSGWYSDLYSGPSNAKKDAPGDKPTTEKPADAKGAEAKTGDGKTASKTEKKPAPAPKPSAAE